MHTGKKIKVLIVDDSAVYREFLTIGLSSDENIDIVATANDPFDAKDKIIKYTPDVMTCDVEMPKMNGIEFIRQLLPQYHLPVVVVSTISNSIFDALNAGAVDFVGKPDMNSLNSVENFIKELIYKVKIATSSKVLQEPINEIKNTDNSKKIFDPRKIIAIGASTGGTEAIANLVRDFPDNIPGTVIVQHIPPEFSRMFAERLNTSTSLHVKEAQTGDIIEKGKVLIAPGDQHMKVVKNGSNFSVVCFSGDKVNGHCPSVDVLFNSVAKEVGKNSIGIILTGMGYDGAKGLLEMKKNGAKTIGQDEKSSVVYGMPKVAYNIGAVENQTSLDKISTLLFNLLT